MAGPLRSTISFHPLGRTLCETLLLHLAKFSGDWQDAEDACPWEEPAPPDPQRAPPPVTWPGRLLTGRSRHAVLLLPTQDGRAVADAYLTWATQHPRLEATDPYLIIHTDPEAPVEKRRTPRRADADRAVWRDLDALLLAGDETSTVRRPQVFDTLNDLPADVRAAVRVRACGFDQDGKTLNRIWYTALTPPIWPGAQENDPGKARRIAACRTAAEQVGTQLAALAARAWRETTTPPSDGAPARSARPKVPKRVCSWVVRASAEYWPRAETTFWRLLDGDPDLAARPAFAADAITALRTVTAPAIVQHRCAAPAVARAVAALLKEPRPVAPRRTSGGKDAA
jgi:CRISPR system Cascade subunit CasA